MCIGNSGNPNSPFRAALTRIVEQQRTKQGSGMAAMWGKGVAAKVGATPGAPGGSSNAAPGPGGAVG